MMRRFRETVLTPLRGADKLPSKFIPVVGPKVGEALHD